jgi:hypothetical protein
MTYVMSEVQTAPKFEHEPFGSWKINVQTTSNNGMFRGTAHFVGKLKSKNTPKSIYVEDDSVAAVKRIIKERILARTESAELEDYTDFALDLNVEFTRDYLEDGRRYIKFEIVEGLTYLVLPPTNYVPQDGDGFWALNLRKDSMATRTDLFGHVITPAQAKKFGFIPHGRYEVVEAHNFRGFTYLNIAYHSRMLYGEKVHLPVPGFTVGAW